MSISSVENGYYALKPQIKKENGAWLLFSFQLHLHHEGCIHMYY